MISLKCDCIEELIKASQGYIENDTVFENIKILNVFTKEWISAHVYIYKKWISHVEYDVDKPLMNSKILLMERISFFVQHLLMHIHMLKVVC